MEARQIIAMILSILVAVFLIIRLAHATMPPEPARPPRNWWMALYRWVGEFATFTVATLLTALVPPWLMLVGLGVLPAWIGAGDLNHNGQVVNPLLFGIMLLLIPAAAGYWMFVHVLARHKWMREAQQ